MRSTEGSKWDDTIAILLLQKLTLCLGAGPGMEAVYSTRHIEVPLLVRQSSLTYVHFTDRLLPMWSPYVHRTRWPCCILYIKR